MALMTGEQYIESIRKIPMEIYMFGKKVENPVDNPILRPSLNSVRMTYDLAQMPEYQELMTAISPEIGERIKVAREFGDISENSEYDDAKNEQGMMEARIAEISRILSEATVVNTPKRSNSVHIGSTVTVDMGGRERVFTIVGGAESDAAAGKISNESPVGSVLLGHKKGDVVETTGPTGRKITMTILKLEH